MAPKVLLVQTQPQAALFLTRFFEERGDDVSSVLDLGQAATRLAQYRPDLMVLDLHFPGNEWQAFLRILHVEYPELKVIVTNKYPDIEREMKAQELGVKAFVRQPFTVYWLNKALEIVGWPVGANEFSDAFLLEQETRQVRVPVRLKITVPMMVLTLFFALVGAFIISQIILDVAQSRFEDQLVDSGVQAADWMVRQEERLLETQRLVANSQGIAELVQNGQAEALRALILPVAVNTDEETIEVLDASGVSVLSMRKAADGGLGEYAFSRGDEFFKDSDIVRKALTEKADEQGNKFAGLISAPWGNYFYIAGPILDDSGRVAGVLLTGRSPENMLAQMRQEKAPYEVTFYDARGRPLASTLYSESESFPLALSQVSQLFSGQEANSLTRRLSVSGAGYTEIIGVWEARGGVDLGLMGVALERAFLIRTSELARFEIFAAVAAGILLVVAVGFYLGGLISAPVQRLTEASAQLAHGDFGVKLDVKGNDEMAALAQSFNYMVTGLQEGIIFRDLLGRSASPELREQLRQTFSSGNLRLEGQESVATILISSIAGWPQVTGEAEPAKVFSWLNEYFSRLVPLVIAHGGVVNQFDGGSMLSLYGLLPVPKEPKDSAYSACTAAVQMAEAIETFNRQRLERGDPPMVTEISIHTGKIIAGALGSTDRLHYTVMGDGVDTARHLARLAPGDQWNQSIVISQATYEALAECAAEFSIQSMGRHALNDRNKKVEVYRLLSLNRKSRAG